MADNAGRQPGSPSRGRRSASSRRSGNARRSGSAPRQPSQGPSNQRQRQRTHSPSPQRDPTSRPLGQGSHAGPSHGTIGTPQRHNSSLTPGQLPQPATQPDRRRSLRDLFNESLLNNPLASVVQAVRQNRADNERRAAMERQAQQEREQYRASVRRHQAELVAADLPLPPHQQGGYSTDAPPPYRPRSSGSQTGQGSPPPPYNGGSGSPSRHS